MVTGSWMAPKVCERAAARTAARSGDSASVLFLAKIFEAGVDRSFVELSDFLHDGEGWRSLHGVAIPRARINVPPEELTIALFSSLAS